MYGGGEFRRRYFMELSGGMCRVYERGVDSFRRVGGVGSMGDSLPWCIQVRPSPTWFPFN